MRRMLNVRLLLVLASAIAAPQVFAQTLPASVIACADETDVLKRLSCYDREVARYRAHPAASTTAPPGTTAPAAASAAAPAAGSAASAGAPPAPASAAAAAPSASRPSSASGTRATSAGTASPADQQAEFGMNGELKRKEQGPNVAAEPAKLEQLTARITSLAYKPHGESILTLDDGQTWEEAENTTHVPYHVGDEVTIKRGVLGAFYLSSSGVRGMRVKRVH
jgi:hypothetical protein